LSDPKPALGDLMPRVLDYWIHERSLTLAVLSKDLRVMEASEKFREFQGDPMLEPIGGDVTELIWELIGCEEGLQEVLEGKAEKFSLQNLNRKTVDGSSIFLSLTILPLSEDEPGGGLLLIIEDTTFTSTLERELVQDRNELRLTKNSLSKANEELLKLNRLKSLFLSIAAHDLRSPLTAMLGYTDLAINSLPPDSRPEIAEYLSIVQSLVDTQSRLISDFLDLDILEQGRLNIRPEPCQLNTIVPDVVDVMKAIARRKKIRIETRLADELPAMYADPDRIRQILFNLLANAIKYTNEGDQVEVETDSDEKHIRFIVSDHGPGIPESDIPFLFDLYHRTEEARQSKTKGLGLGLFIVKSLVDLHKGEISVLSKPGKGTEFIVGIPQYQAAPGGKA
jgi:signal transduction histidine kinase